MNSPTLTPATHRAHFAIGDERAAKGVVDVLTEIFFEGEAAVAAFERPDGRWDVTVHFAEAPDQALLRQLVADAASEEIAGTIAFDTVEAKDWVKASLEDLVPVPAGRFVVHGAHDRARVPPNKLGIEIEAALAFGTGHHGTTRGCLLLLDHVLKAHRPRRMLDLGTGTGVLAIAAAKAMHRNILASDIDAPSVRRGARECAAQRRGRSGAGDPRHRFLGAGIFGARPVRAGAGQHPGQSAAATLRAACRASRAKGVRDPVGAVEPPGDRRHRRLSCARAGAAAASEDRRLEQPVAAPMPVMAVEMER